MYGGAHPLKSRIDGGRSLFALQRDPEWKWLQQAESSGTIFARVLPRLCCSVTIGAEHPSCDESHGSCRAACLNIVFVQRVFKTAGSDRAHSISDTVIITQCI